MQAVADLTREHETLRDTEGVIARLVEEDTGLRASQDNDGDLRAEAALALQRVASALATAQDVAEEPGARLSELTARRGRLPVPSMNSGNALPGLNGMRAKPAQTARPCSTRWAPGDRPAGRCGGSGGSVIASNETAANHAEVALRVARQVEADLARPMTRRGAGRGPADGSPTLTNLLKAADDDLWPALVGQLKVERAMKLPLVQLLAMISMRRPMKARPPLAPSSAFG